MLDFDKPLHYICKAGNQTKSALVLNACWLQLSKSCNYPCGGYYHLLAPARDILLLVTRARINTSESHQAVVSKLNCSSNLSSSFCTVSSWAGVSQAMAELVKDRPAANK